MKIEGDLKIMAFEIEIEITRSFISTSVREIQGRTEEIRTKTTPDNFAGLIKCVEEGAKRFGSSAHDLLKRTKSVKLRAPEIVPDTLANRSGAKVGLVVSKGHEKNVYFEGVDKNPVLDSIVMKEMIVGIEEETDGRGIQILKPRDEEVKDKLRYLLELGSGIIAVGLNHAGLNPANERLVKEMIESDYPRHYLGAVPVLISADFISERDDFLRATVCLLNAYIWFNVDHFLRRVEALLRQNGYHYRLWVAQADGAIVPITRVTPLKTCASDPIGFIKAMVRDLLRGP